MPTHPNQRSRRTTSKACTPTTTDPWNLATSWYERRKYGLTVACLPRERYDSGFEAGCSIGEMTKLLAARCDALLAVDCAPTAVRTARAKLRECDHVAVAHAVLPAQLPDRTFDLLVASEILYYFTAGDLRRLLDGLISRLRPGGEFVAAHWRASDTSYGYDGFNVHDQLRQRSELDTVVHHEDEIFVLDILRRRSRLPGTGSVKLTV
jgi:predicted TPR repeat methyltransferase